MTENKITPPTFWKRPHNAGPLPKAFPKSGDWTTTGKYNGWMAWVHTPTRAMFNRHNEPLSIQSEFREALDVACRLPFEWLCTEALERRHKIGQGSLIILDTPIRGGFLARKNLIKAAALGNGGCLEHTIQGIDTPLENNRVYLPLTLAFTGRIRELVFWQQLQEANLRLRCEFFEGVVCDKDNAEFPMQLRDAEMKFPFSQKHRWQF